MKAQYPFYLLILSLLLACNPKWDMEEKKGYNLVRNEGGKSLGFSPASGVEILTIDRFAFKDLNQNGSLDIYEDWRLSTDERARDLASKMSTEQIAGLMLYSAHQAIPGGGFRVRGTYNGKSLQESGANPFDLTDQQKKFLGQDNLRHVLITRVKSPEVAARWNNNMQAFVEGIGFGVPANNSSDPRHEAASDEEFTLGAGGDISRWPNAIGMAASFDPELVELFGQIASREYRALGVATALSPQVDLATDPRWYRFSGTFGSHPQLATDMAKAYVDGFQSSDGGWGSESVNAMVKHWPGGGTGEGGRDAHYGFGKFAVFPGNNLKTHLKPFIEGAFNLDGGTVQASAVMPYYTISYDQDPSGENVGNAFSKYFIEDQLRGKYGFDGVVCTDWGVTRPEVGMNEFGRSPWGVEDLTEAERHYRILMAGCDQFGGNNDAGPVLEAYQMGVGEFGEQFMRDRFEKSAVRLLRNIFRVGLFENPYVDVQYSIEEVGKAEYMSEGFNAQLKSLVLLKNKNNVLPLTKGIKAYLPQRFRPPAAGFFGPPQPGDWVDPFILDISKRYVLPVEDAVDAEIAILKIMGPENGRTAGYDPEDLKNNGNGFLPVTLQYDSYTATEARDPSLAGDAREGDVLNRTYKGKTVTAKNKSDLQLIRSVRKKIGDKPLILVLEMNNPTIVSEFEDMVDAIVISFGVQDQAIFEILSGSSEPSGLLPLQMPANMSTVELQLEDVPLDMDVHVDSEGNSYNFGFGMDWNGVISDKRTNQYSARGSK